MTTVLRRLEGPLALLLALALWAGACLFAGAGRFTGFVYGGHWLCNFV